MKIENISNAKRAINELTDIQKGLNALIKERNNRQDVPDYKSEFMLIMGLLSFEVSDELLELLITEQTQKKEKIIAIIKTY